MSSKTTSQQPSRHTHFILPLPVVAIASAIVALTSLATLVVITSVEDTGALNTVALSLAILAFVVQLIVYIVQTATANQQLLQAQQLHSATIEILAQIQEKSEGTQATVVTMNEKLLAHVLGKALPEASAAGVDPTSPQFSEMIADHVARRMTEIQRSSGSDGGSITRIRDRAEDAEIYSYMRQYPLPEEIDSVTRTLETLDAEGRTKIANYAFDEVICRSPDSSLEPGLFGGEPNLLSLGLIRPSSSYPGSYILTHEGRKVGRIYTARGSVPEYINQALRNFVAERKAQMDLGGRDR